MNMKVHRWKKTITALAAAASLALAIGAAPSQAATRVESTKVSAGLSASDLSKLPLTNRHLTEREKANLAVVLQAYHDGEGASLDPQGFRDLFAADGALSPFDVRIYEQHLPPARILELIAATEGSAGLPGRRPASVAARRGYKVSLF
jgi:hypothetical protein